VCFASLLALSVIDLDHGVLPARIIYPTLAVTSALLVVAAWADDRWDDLGHAVVGGIAAWVFFGVLWAGTPSPSARSWRSAPWSRCCSAPPSWAGTTGRSSAADRRLPCSAGDAGDLQAVFRTVV
jgi:hypothetical protein